MLDRNFLDCMWFCPYLFDAFNLDSINILISAVLLESTIVLVGKQYETSSAILALNSLLYPFKWCMALVPLLPHQLIEMLEAPMPMLVGITHREYRNLNLTQAERDTKVWVNLTSKQITWSEQETFLILDLKTDQLDSEYTQFKTSLNQSNAPSLTESYIN